MRHLTEQQTGAVLKHFGTLMDRWVDEQKREAFPDYRASMEKALPVGCVEFSMDLRPFRMEFKHNGRQYFTRTTRGKVSLCYCP